MTSSPPTSDPISRLLGEFRRTVAENKYIPITPHPKQALFLANLTSREILYGGAAAGGKSVALLAAALQFVDVPGYNALLLRQSYADLYLAEALIPLSHEWLQGTDAHWNGQKHQWTFPSGATLAFGYLSTEADKYRYQGAAFQFIGFDELTQFRESQYLYLFSRLRKKGVAASVPLRMRAATNPGGIGHKWVKERFITQAPTVDRIFISAKMEDNPSVNQQQYEESLANLDVVTRNQLRSGNWNIIPDGAFQRAWVRHWRREGQRCRLFRKRGDRIAEYDELSKFATVDVAGTEKRAKNHDPDWTVVQVWGLSKEGDLILLDQWRGQSESPDVQQTIIDLVNLHELPWVGVESAGIGMPLIQSLRKHGIAVRGFKAKGSKISRAQAAQIRMEAGTVYFPADAPWRDTLETELFQFPSGPHDDQVDALSYAAIWAQRVAGNVKRDTPEVKEEVEAQVALAAAMAEAVPASVPDEDEPLRTEDYFSAFGEDD